MTPPPTRILIVEDERIVARDIQRRLTHFGYEVVGVTGSGEHAAMLAKEMRPDLVLMDIHLNGDIDGVSAAESIRAACGTPVVYLTAYADEQTLERARVTEPFGYILKPFEERELRTVIEMALYRHGSEQRLRASERRYAVTLGSIGDGVIATDVRGHVTFMNPVAESLTGWKSEECNRLPIDQIFPLTREDTGAALAGPVAKVLQTGAVVSLANHTLLTNRSGQKIPIDDCGAPIRSEDGDLLGAVLVFHDISERRRAEDALRQAEQKYRSIFENAVEGIFQMTRDGRLLTANPALARICGHGSPEELIATVTDFSAVLVADPARREEYLGALLERGVVKSFEAQALHKDGSRVWVSLSVREVGHPVTRAVCYEGMVEEITDRIRLEEQFRQAQKMEAIGRLAGGVAHDFNNILTVILSHCELLLRGKGRPEERREDLISIRDAAEHAALLTQQLLMFGRKQTHRPVPLDFNHLVRRIERMLNRVIGENIALSTQLETDLWTVTGDPGQMEQVIMNLTVNARDAMPRGGTLRIATRNVERSRIDAVDDPEILPGRYVVLEIEDTGSGMDAATRARLYEPFFTTKEVGKGTGLGLATIYGIVTQSEGHIRVSSEVGKGTTFTVWLPASLHGPTQPSVLPMQTADHLEGGTMLIVDDDAGIRRLGRRILEDHGVEVLEAVNGLEALEICRRHGGPIDLVLTDVIMPEMGGLELAGRLAAERPEIPVLFMSGYLEGAAPGRPEHMLAKPFTPDELVRSVHQARAHVTVPAPDV